MINDTTPKKWALNNYKNLYNLDNRSAVSLSFTTTLVMRLMGTI